MMVQLIPDQIAALWDYIKFAFEESIPPSVNKNDYDSNKVLASLLSGKCQCWILYEKLKNNDRRFEGVVITQIVKDTISQQKQVLIYSLYGDNISKKSWQEGFLALGKWALANDCKSLTAYTENKLMINKALQFGGTASTFLSVPLEAK